MSGRNVLDQRIILLKANYDEDRRNSLVWIQTVDLILRQFLQIWKRPFCPRPDKQIWNTLSFTNQSINQSIKSFNMDISVTDN